MTPGKTLVAFGIYIIGAATLLLLAPGLLFALLFSPPPTDPYYLVIALIAAALGFYYIQSGRNELIQVAQTTVIGRSGFSVGVLMLVLLGWLPAGLLLLAVIDVAGAIWTAKTLKNAGHKVITI